MRSARQVGFAGGDADGEPGPAVHLALDFHRAAVQPRQLLHEREADAAALEGPGAGVLDAVEPLEEVRQLLGGDARPGVAHGQPDAAALAPQPDLDFALEGELEGVREQVEDDLLPHLAVHVDRLAERRAVHDEPQPGALDGRTEDAAEVRRERGQVGGLVRRLDASGLEAREVQERVDQLQQAQGVAVRHLQPLAVRGGKLAGVGQRVFERAEHQGERRAELVRDVGEEGRLRAVQLGQDLGAPAFLLVGAGVGDGVGDLPGGELEEAAVLAVQRQAGADAGDQETGRQLLRSGLGERQHQRVPGAVVRPRAGGPPSEPLVRILDDLALAGPDDAAEGPDVVLAVEGGEVDRLAEARLPVFVEQVDQREGEIVRVAGERAGGGVADLLDGPGFGQAVLAEVAQRPQAPLAQDAAGVLRAGAEDSAHAARVVRRGAVGKGEVGLFGVPMPLHEQERLFVPRPPAFLHHDVRLRAYGAPDVPPDLRSGPAEGRGVALAEDGDVGVVVEVDELASPPDEHGIARVEHDADGGLQALRPPLDRSDRRPGPVERAHPLAHLSAADEVVGGGLTLLDGRSGHGMSWNKHRPGINTRATENSRVNPTDGVPFRGLFQRSPDIYVRAGAPDKLPPSTPGGQRPDRQGLRRLLQLQQQRPGIVRQVHDELKKRGVRVWMDEKVLPYGQPWQPNVEATLQNVDAAAIFLGPPGFGDWQKQEARLCQTQGVKRGMPVIPVLLPDGMGPEGLPSLLAERTCCDLRDGLAADKLDRLAREDPGDRWRARFQHHPGSRPGSAPP